MRLTKQLLNELTPLRALILPLYIPCLLFSLGVGASIFIFPLFAIKLGGSVALAGLVLGIKGAGTLLTNIPAGIFVSTFGGKNILLYAALLLSVAGIGAGQINSTITLLVCSFIIGIVVSLWFLARLTYISNHIPQKILGRAMSILSSVEKIGLLIAPLIAGYLIVLFNHGVAFQLITAMGLISFLLVYCFADNEHLDKRQRKKNRLQIITKIISESKKLFLIVGSVILIMLLLRTAMQTILPVWGLAIDLNAAQIGQIIFAVGLVDFMMFIPAGLILDYWGRKWSALPSFVFFTIGYAVLPLATDYQSFLTVALLIGLANGLSTGWGNTLISDLSPAKHRGESIAIWRTIGDTGSLSGPLAVGFLASSLSLPIASIVIAVIGVLGIAILGTKVKETLQH